VRVLSRGEDTDLESSTTLVHLNRIGSTNLTTSMLLGRSDRGWHLDLLGRNRRGPRPIALVTVALDLRDFVDRVARSLLRSDERGRIELGALEGVVQLSRFWPERRLGRNVGSADRAAHLAQSVHGAEGRSCTSPTSDERRAHRAQPFR
jgi:hypothetical protein